MCSANRRRGVIYALVIVALAVLFAAIGAAVDVGKLTLTKSRLQTYCDMAALAAATTVADSEDSQTWDTAATYYSDNIAPDSDEVAPQLVEYLSAPDIPCDPSGAEYTVGSDTVQVRHPYRDDTTDQAGYDFGYLVAVSARRTVRLPFLGVLGIGPVDVTARAVALAEPGGGGAIAIFAHRTDPDPYGFKWTGSGGLIVGNAHSNSKVKFTGSRHHCTGWIEYRYAKQIFGSNHQVDGGFREGDIEDYPISFDPPPVSDFQFDFYINGDYHVTGSNHVIAPGTYYVAGDVHIDGSDHAGGPITFVAEGRIHISGSGHQFSADCNDVLFYSLWDRTTPAIDISGHDYDFEGQMIAVYGKVQISGSDHSFRADDEEVLIYSGYNGAWAIDMSGSGGQFEGVCFAPNGAIQYSGSGHHIFRGALIADKILVTGSDFTVEGTVSAGPSGPVHARLVE